MATRKKQISTEELNLARKRVAAKLRKLGAAPDDVDDLTQDALIKWLEQREVAPETFAERTLGDHVRKQSRRAHLVQGRGIDLRRGTVGGQAATEHGERVRRFKRREEPELRKALELECRARFEKSLGIRWQAEFATIVNRSIRDDEFQDFLEAHRIHDRLRQAIGDAVAFVRKSRPSLRAAPLGLDWWVPQHIEPLARHAFLRPRTTKVGPLAHAQHYAAATDQLVRTFDDYELLPGLKKYETGGSRLFDAEEFALLWLLAGRDWPNFAWPVQGLTAAELIRKQVDPFRKAIQRVGRQWQRGPAEPPADADDEDVE